MDVIQPAWRNETHGSSSWKSWNLSSKSCPGLDTVCVGITFLRPCLRLTHTGVEPFSTDCTGRMWKNFLQMQRENVRLSGSEYIHSTDHVRLILAFALRPQLKWFSFPVISTLEQPLEPTLLTNFRTGRGQNPSLWHILYPDGWYSCDSKNMENQDRVCSGQ